MNKKQVGVICDNEYFCSNHVALTRTELTQNSFITIKQIDVKCDDKYFYRLLSTFHGNSVIFTKEEVKSTLAEAKT